MLGRTSKICFFAAVFVGVSAPCPSADAQAVAGSKSTPISEIVLLDNGRALQGQVTRTVDEVHVRTRSGSRIILPAKRVESIFDSLSDVWTHRGSKLDSNDIEGHLALFHWCVKHRLQNEAQQQLDRLMQTEIDVRRLKYLDRKLVRTFEPPKEGLAKQDRKNKPSDDSLGKSLSYLDVPEVFQSLPAVESKRKPMPSVMFDQAVKLASHSEPATVETKDAEESDSASKPGKKSVQLQLDSMTDLLAREDLHQFQRRVQPILLKGCLAAKCHNSTAAVMPLLHRGRGQLVPKRFTQRNLLSIVDWIDQSETDRSKLLKQALTVHGGQEIPAMQVGSKEFGLLSEWLQQVAKNSPELIPVKASSVTPGKVALVGLESSENQVSGATKPHGEPRLSRGVKPSEELPEPVVDPFDPAAFNRLPK